MSFDTLETEIKRPASTQAMLTYMRYERKDGRQKDGHRPRLMITLPTTIFLSKMDKFKLLIGSKENAGKLRVVAHQDGVKAATLKHVARLNFGYVPRLGDDIFDEYRADVKRIDDNTYEIEVGQLFEQQTEAPAEKVRKIR